MTTINTRLAQLIDSLGLNPNSFSKDMGISATTIYHIIGGRYSEPSFSLIQKIVDAFPAVNLDWLVKGEGDMLSNSNAFLPESVTNVSKPEPNIHKSITNSSQTSKQDSNFGTKPKQAQEPLHPYGDFRVEMAVVDMAGNSVIPMVNHKAAANWQVGYNSQEYLEELGAISLPAHMAKGGQHYAIQVLGDSMHPSLIDSDWLVVRQLQPIEYQYIKDGNIYIIHSKERGLQVKRLHRSPSGSFLCVSDNPSYPTYEVEEASITQAFEVRYRLSPHMPVPTATLAAQVAQLASKLTELEHRINTMHTP
jgi:SOS-response transcriptional repressor LexA